MHTHTAYRIRMYIYSSDVTLKFGHKSEVCYVELLMKKLYIVMS